MLLIGWEAARPQRCTGSPGSPEGGAQCSDDLYQGETPGSRRTQESEPIVVNVQDFKQAARSALTHATQLADLPADPWTAIRACLAPV